MRAWPNTSNPEKLRPADFLTGRARTVEGPPPAHFHRTVGAARNTSMPVLILKRTAAQSGRRAPEPPYGGCPRVEVCSLADAYSVAIRYPVEAEDSLPLGVLGQGIFEAVWRGQSPSSRPLAEESRSNGT